MTDTNPAELNEAIRVFKVRYGDKEPLNMFTLDDIITELREATKAKTKGKK
mgnify:CR=1 FL=1